MDEPTGFGARTSAMRALWATAEASRVAAGLADAGYEALILRGPAMQRRVGGSPSMYMSGDVDVLVHASDRGCMMEHLSRAGFRRLPRTGSAGRFSTRVTLERGGFAVDLHRGLDLPPYPRWSFRSLERELWRGATLGRSGFLEPRPEPLAVLLAAHAVARGFDPPALRRTAIAAASLADPMGMWDLARRSRLVGAVRLALGEPASPAPFQLDGSTARATRVASAAARGDMGPRAVTDRLHEYAGYLHLGVPVLRPTKPTMTVGQLRFEVWDGVCGPGTWTGPLIDAWLRCTRGIPAPVLVDVGTGTGCLAVIAALRSKGAIVHATDVSARAVRNAKANVARHGARVTVSRGDLLSAVPRGLGGRVDGILAHLPSMPPGGPRARDDDHGLEGGRRAPRETYEGPGGDGLGLVRAFLRAAPPWLAADGCVIVSMQSWQWERFSWEAGALGYRTVGVDSPSDQGAIVTLTR